MAEFTKEQLIEKLERRLAVTTHYPDSEEAQLDAQIFKIALEALTAGMEQGKSKLIQRTDTNVICQECRNSAAMKRVLMVWGRVVV